MELNKKTLLRLFLLAVGCVVLYWVLCEMDKVLVILRAIGNVISPFVTGAIIAFILNVPMRAFEGLFKRIQRPGLRRAAAIIFTLLSVLVVLVGVCGLLIPQLIIAIIQLFSSLSGLPEEAVNAARNLLAKYPQIYEWVTSAVDWGSVAQSVFPKIGDIATIVLSQTVSFISSLANGVVNAFIAVVFSIYCLFNKDSLARQGRKILYAFFPEKFSDRVVRVLRLSNVTFSNFLSGQCVEACILGCLFAIAMALFRMPYIPLISVLIAVTAFIPIVGALVGCFVGAFLIATTDPILAIYFVIMSIVLQQLENNLIYPRVVGTSIGLPGMWVLFAVTVGGAVMGVGGMFMMIPLSSVLYSLVRMYTNKRLQNSSVDPDKLRCHPIKFREEAKNKNKKKTKKKKDPESDS